jgi:hypothetical protein
MEFTQETLQMIELPKDKISIKYSRRACKWSKPPDDIVKINSDGSLQLGTGMTSSGLVARDDRSFRGASCKICASISNHRVAEALSLRDAVSYAVERGSFFYFF